MFFFLFELCFQRVRFYKNYLSKRRVLRINCSILERRVFLLKFIGLNYGIIVWFVYIQAVLNKYIIKCQKIQFRERKRLIIYI